MDKTMMCANTNQLDTMMEEIFGEHLHTEIPTEELVALNDGKPLYQFRYREVTMRLTTLIGHITIAQFEDMIRNWLHVIIVNNLPIEQEGEWKLVGWGCEPTVKYMNSRKGNPNAKAWNRYEEGNNPGGGTPNPQKTAMYRVEEPALRIKAAFVDTLQSEVVDGWLNTTGLPGGPLSKFCKTGELKHLPKVFRDQRAKCVEMLTAAEDQPIQASTQSELTDDLVEAARVLRGSGMAWGSIGKALHIPWQTVRAAVGDDNEATT